MTSITNQAHIPGAHPAANEPQLSEQNAAHSAYWAEGADVGEVVTPNLEKPTAITTSVNTSPIDPATVRTALEALRQLNSD